MEPNHDACHGTGLVRGMTWSKTWALRWSGFHGSSTNLSVKYSTLAIPTDSLLYTCKWGMLFGCSWEVREGKESVHDRWQLKEQGNIDLPGGSHNAESPAERRLLLKLSKNTKTLNYIKPLTHYQQCNGHSTHL